MSNELDELENSQLELIGHVDRRMARYLVAGGWAVDGIEGRITRYHKNVDLMIFSDHVPLAVEVLKEIGVSAEDCCGRKLIPDSKPYFFRGKDGKGLRVDVSVMHPVGGGGLPPTKMVRFLAPYHGITVTSENHLEGQNVSLEGVGFVALNADALYTAKLIAAGSAEERERDEKDLMLLEPHITEELKNDTKRLKVHRRHLDFLMSSGSSGQKGF